MSRSAEYRAYEYATEVLASDRTEDFEQLRNLVETFPHGVDELFGRPWIHNAIDCGSVEAVRWMIDDKVDLAIRDEDGNTPLHAALQRDLPNKYEILELLLRAGAPMDAPGLDDQTPAGFAAALNDGDALRLFADYAGASARPGNEGTAAAH